MGWNRRPTVAIHFWVDPELIEPGCSPQGAQSSRLMGNVAFAYLDRLDGLRSLRTPGGQGKVRRRRLRFCRYYGERHGMLPTWSSFRTPHGPTRSCDWNTGRSPPAVGYSEGARDGGANATRCGGRRHPAAHHRCDLHAGGAPDRRPTLRSDHQPAVVALQPPSASHDQVGCSAGTRES
jgi:hypothetical protein